MQATPAIAALLYPDVEAPQEIAATFNKFEEFKLPLHITEFIPQSSGKNITGG